MDSVLNCHSAITRPHVSNQHRPAGCLSVGVRHCVWAVMSAVVVVPAGLPRDTVLLAPEKWLALRAHLARQEQQEQQQEQKQEQEQEHRRRAVSAHLRRGWTDERKVRNEGARAVGPARVDMKQGEAHSHNQRRRHSHAMLRSSNYLLWISDPVRPRFLAITSSGLARSLSNFRTLHFSPSADFCQYGLLTKNR